MREIHGDEAYKLSKIARYLFADLLLKFDDVLGGRRILLEKPATGAFKLVEKELGYIYDVMYTKASIIYSKQGFFLRLISLLCSICSLTAFPFIIGKYDYSKIDEVITYLLLVVAILLEIYALYLVIFSDWIRVLEATNSKRWSRSMAQHNLLEFYLESQTKRFIKKFATSKYEEQEVKDPLKNVIFQKIKKNDDECFKDGEFHQETQNKLLAERGKKVLEDQGDQVLRDETVRNCLVNFREYTIDVDFDHSLLIWHIATCICDRKQVERKLELVEDISNHELGRYLSDYMLYLLVECQQMQPKVNGPSFYLDTCEHAKKIFKEKPNLAKAFKSKERLDLQQFINETESTTSGDGVPTRTPTPAPKNYESQLNLGFKLAQKLQNLGRRNKWKLISKMWVEMLIYATSHGDWRYHAQRLTKGEELLTHVALLMAQVGFSQQCKLDSTTCTDQTHGSNSS